MSGVELLPTGRPLSGLPLLIQAIDQHQPRHIFAMLSGGNDSVVALDVARRHPQFSAAVFVDTGINVPGAEERVAQLCRGLGVELLVYRAMDNRRADNTLDPQDYDEMVREYGFPGSTTIGHGKMFNRLKGRAFERLVREHRGDRGGRVMLVSGSRKSESARRDRNVKAVKAVGGTIWVAPLWDWSTRQRDQYLATMGLPRNPYSPLIGVSGDCLCGAYAKPGQLAAVRRHFPCVGRRLDALAEQTREAGMPWGWEDSPPANWAMRHEQGLFEPSVAYEYSCAGCAVAQIPRLPTP